jgi:DNA-binding LacI/PurR family transcriptional regulator
MSQIRAATLSLLTQERVTLKSLAMQLGVSPMTVSNAFNRPQELSSDLRERIIAAAAKVGYHSPRPSGRMLKTGRVGAFALFNPDPIPHLFEDPFASAFVAGISEICEKYQYGLTLLPRVKDASQMNAIDQVAVDGFILHAIPEQSSIIPRIRGRQLPIVTVDMGKLPGVPTIGIDDREAARKIASHVLELGHKKIAVLSLEMKPDGFSGRVTSDRMRQCSMAVPRQRLLGYSDALAKSGMDLETVAVYEVRGNNEMEAYHWATTFLKRKVGRPTAVLAMSDCLALGGLRAGIQLGLSVPRDISIVGFDDIPQASAFRPSLTTIRQPMKEKGYLAASMLVGELPYTEETRILPIELIVRESVAAPRKPIG